MPGDGRLLAVGPAAFTDSVLRAAPTFEVVASTSMLDGLWTFGQGEFDAAVVAASDPRMIRLVESMRRVRPTARIVVAVEAPEEPLAQRLVGVGAHEYVLEPLQRGELEAALGRRAVALASHEEPDTPTHDEIVQLGEVLRSLSSGVAPTLERLAVLVCAACDARGARIETRDAVAEHGEIETVVLAEPIRRGSEVIGRISLGPRRRAAYSSVHVGRLAIYARLADTIIEQIRDREHWRELAHRDELTPARNARYFAERFDELLKESEAARRGVTLVLLRIEAEDGIPGDVALREAADLLARCTREPDLVARVQTDTFAAVLVAHEAPRIPGSPPPTDGLTFAERFAPVLRTGIFSQLGAGGAARLVAFVGLASFPWDGRTRDELVTAATAAMRSARDAGRLIPLSGPVSA